MKCFHSVYLTKHKTTKTIYWGYITKREANKRFKELVESDQWDCIVVDDITEQEYKKQK